MLWVGGWRLESKIYPFCRPVHKIVTVLPGGSFPARVPFARTPIHMTCTAWCNQCHSIKSIYLRKVGRFSLKSEFPAVWVRHPPEKLKHFPDYQYNVKNISPINQWKRIVACPLAGRPLLVVLWQNAFSPMMKVWINLGLGVFMKRLAEITKGLKLNKFIGIQQIIKEESKKTFCMSG